MTRALHLIVAAALVVSPAALQAQARTEAERRAAEAEGGDGEWAVLGCRDLVHFERGVDGVEEIDEERLVGLEGVVAVDGDVDRGARVAGADRERLIDAMVEHPILIERPFVVTPRGTRLARPLDSVREIL